MILIMQHAACEGPAYLMHMMEQRGLKWQVCSSVNDDWPVELDGYEAIIVLGGPQSVNDAQRYPRIQREINLVHAAMAREIPILGICLGAQILASACGLQVAPTSRKEIGWFAATRTAQGTLSPYFRDVPDEFTCFHWHGEQILATEEPASLAQSELTDCQAIELRPGVLALQFHLEVTEDAIRAMAGEFSAELREEGIGLGQLLENSRELLPASRKLADSVIGHWFDVHVPGRRQQGASA